MIFVILGSQKNQFNRLLRSLDEQVSSGRIGETLFAQTGYSDYEPRHFKYRHFLDRDVFERMEEQAELIITHGGTGSIMGALKKGKPVIAVPRRFDLGEHNDTHQIQVVSQLAQTGLITCCEDPDQLAEMIVQVQCRDEKTPREGYHSHTAAYLEEIGSFIDEIS